MRVRAVRALPHRLCSFGLGTLPPDRNPDQKVLGLGGGTHHWGRLGVVDWKRRIMAWDEGSSETHRFAWAHLSQARLCGRNPRMLQVDRLLADAQAASRIPLYCLYNYWTASTADPAWPCQSYPQRRTFWGCSIAHAQSVAHCINSGTNTLASLRQYIRPWMCLVCCSGFRPSGKAAERTYAYLEHGLPRSGGLDTKLPGVVRNLPAYVVRAVHGEPGVVMPDNLRGIMVITSKPDEPHSQPE